MTGVGQLAKHLTDDNHREVLERAKHKTMREIDLLVAELAPEPERASRLAVVPKCTAAKPAVAHIGTLLVDQNPALLEHAATRTGDALFREHSQGLAADVSPALASQTIAACVTDSSTGHAAAHRTQPRAPDPRPIAPERFRLSVTLSQEGYARLRQLQALWAHRVPDGDPALIVEKALQALLEQSLKEKASQTKRPREPRETTANTPRVEEEKNASRTIPAAVRRAVWARDEGRCAFVSATGHRCATDRCLEFHHVKPWARGGTHGVDNIELRCRAHNQLQAERDYGRLSMDSRRGKHRVEEKRVRYERVVTVRAAQKPTSKRSLCGSPRLGAVPMTRAQRASYALGSAADLGPTFLQRVRTLGEDPAVDPYNRARLVATVIQGMPSEDRSYQRLPPEARALVAGWFR